MFQYKDTNKSLSMCSPSCPTLCDPMDCSPARLLCPWNFSRQEYWSGLPFPTLGDLSHPGTESNSLVSCIGKQVHYHWSHLGSPLWHLTQAGKLIAAPEHLCSVIANIIFASTITCKSPLSIIWRERTVTSQRCYPNKVFWNAGVIVPG